MALTKIDDRGLKTPIDLLDNENIRLGTGNDLKLYHDGSNSHLNNITGNLLIGTNGEFQVLNHQENEYRIRAHNNGGVDLYYDNSKKFETNSVGCQVLGTISSGNITVSDTDPRIRLVDTDHNSDFSIYGNGGAFSISDDTNTANRFKIDSNGHVQIPNDSCQLQLGAGQDLQIYHDGSHSKIVNSTGVLKVQGAAGQSITFRNSDDSANVAVFNIDADTHLYYDSAHKFSTTSDGCLINGHLDLSDGNVVRLGSGDDLQLYHDGSSNHILYSNGNLLIRQSNHSSSQCLQFDGNGHLYVPDNEKIYFGASADLQIYHNGSNSYLANTTGQLVLEGNDLMFMNSGRTEALARFQNGGSVELYHNDSKKLETASYGVNVISSGSSHGLYVSHSNGNEVARLAHNGSGDEGVLVLRDGGNVTTLINGESGQNSHISGPNAFMLGTGGNGVGSSQRGIQLASATTGTPVLIQTSSSHYTSGAYSHWYLYDDHGVVGFVNADGDGTASYNTASDYRLKENVVPITDGIAKLKTLKPYRFNFKTADASKVVQGFFAHEVSEAVPNAVKGTKDEMKSLYYEEGDTIPNGKAVGDFKEYSTTEINTQGLDHAKMVPMLTAALQEAIAKIEILETKVAALEAA